MSDTAGEDRKTQRDNGGHGHDVHGHGHVGRGKDGKAKGDPHDGAAIKAALTAMEASGEEQPGGGAEGSNSAESPQATSQY